MQKPAPLFQTLKCIKSQTLNFYYLRYRNWKIKMDILITGNFNSSAILWATTWRTIL